MTETESEWVPGDPIYRQGSYTNYLFNFRDDPDTEECRCTDAAHWPGPGPINSRRIEDDPLAAFIAEYHEWESRDG